MRSWAVHLSVWLLLVVDSEARGAGDPLPSWHDTPTKRAILEYVEVVTDAGGRAFVTPEDRIATFDNDGTLWCEKPL